MKTRLYAGAKYKSTHLIIVEIGINDSALLNDKRKCVSINQFKLNIEKIIHICKKFSSKIVFISILPVVEQLTTPISWNKQKYHRNLCIEKYNNVLNKVCARENVYYLELYPYWVKINYQILLTDGVHPNAMGHKKIYDAVIDFLIKNKLI